jgi:hypothetical protein
MYISDDTTVYSLLHALHWRFVIDEQEDRRYSILLNIVYPEEPETVVLRLNLTEYHDVPKDLCDPKEAKAMIIELTSCLGEVLNSKTNRFITIEELVESVIRSRRLGF